MQEVFEKIIEKLEERSKEYNSGVRLHGKPEEMLTCEAIEIVKQAAEEYDDGWIPVEERLPDVPEGTEDDDCPEFNVTIKGASRAAILRCSSDGTWFDEFGHVYPVIAWQPLPEPYQPENN